MDNKRSVNELFNTHDVFIIAINTIVDIVKEGNITERKLTRLIILSMFTMVCLMFPKFELFLTAFYTWRKHNDFFKLFVYDYCESKIKDIQLELLGADNISIEYARDLLKRGSYYADIRDRKVHTLSAYIELKVEFYKELTSLTYQVHQHPYRQLGISL